MLPACLGPVGGHEVEVGVVGKVPEGLGEAQVVADEQRGPDAFDVDRDVLVAGPVALVLPGVGERVELVVVVRGAVGGRNDEAVDREFAGDVERGDGAGGPAAVAGGLAAQPFDARPVGRLDDQVRGQRESGREHLGQHHQVRPPVGGLGDHPFEVGVVGVAVLPDHVVLDGGNLHCAPPRVARRSTASVSTSGCLQNANRTRWRPAASSS